MKPAEWRWVAVFAVAVMAFTTVPYAVGFAAQRDGWQFGGFLIGVEDGNAYLARMRQGAEGQWLDTLAFSTDGVIWKRELPHTAVRDTTWCNPAWASCAL